MPVTRPAERPASGQSFKKWRRFGLPVLWFLPGLLFVVLLPLAEGGWHLPGDVGDTRLNNILLEHVYRWIVGDESSFWNATFFYPFPLAIAFGDNLLGAAPAYALLRIFGLDREQAHLGWFVVGYSLNYFSAFYVLRQLALRPISAALGAFFFSFGLPMTGQELHNQLLYRWCVPFATFGLYRFAERADPRWLVTTVVLLVVQLYTSIYTGVFLLLLLFSMTLVLAVTRFRDQPWLHRWFWFGKNLRSAWLAAGGARATVSERAWRGGRGWKAILVVLLLASVAALVGLAYPYISVVRDYGFARGWPEVSGLLPRLQSYLHAPHSLLWRSESPLLQQLPTQLEHSLFIGLPMTLLLLAGLMFRLDWRQREFALVSIVACALLMVLTLNVWGESLYRVIFLLPGFGAIRALTRIQLVNMWPLAVFSAFVLDAFLRADLPRINRSAVVVILGTFLVVESSAVSHHRVLFQTFRERSAKISAAIPDEYPKDPILFVANTPQESFWVGELAAVAVAQDKGWATLNGYAGNVPPGFVEGVGCSAMPLRIIGYLKWRGKHRERDYLRLAQRVVPIGFRDCSPSWWRKMPSITFSALDFSREDFRKVRIKIPTLHRSSGRPLPGKATLVARIRIENHSPRLLHTYSTTGHHIRVAWRWFDLRSNTPLSKFNQRRILASDVQPASSLELQIELEAPRGDGDYVLEASIVQEGVFWLHDLGVAPARAKIGSSPQQR
ncbi:MAG: hypothetical protein JRH20_05800 [Deltaproteobacteria bacterium]|nr:hypothetical protein [Deltaproteobacteria bacterium]